MCFNMFSEDASAVGFIHNSSSTERVHQFRPTYKISCRFHDLATMFAQLEAKDSDGRKLDPSSLTGGALLWEAA